MDLLYKDLTEKIIGAAYKVYNTIGFGFQEKEYQNALAAELEVLKIKFERESYTLV